MTQVKDYSDLTQVSTDKLIKLRDVAKADIRRLHQEKLESEFRLQEIQIELSQRTINSVK